VGATHGRLDQKAVGLARRAVDGTFVAQSKRLSFRMTSM
jgi:hypothetical protein